MIKVLFIITGLYLAVLISSCKLESEHKIESVHEVKPIHITIDLNIKVDKALDNYFGDLDEAESKIEK
jgi:hypothetical protein